MNFVDYQNIELETKSLQVGAMHNLQQSMISDFLEIEKRKKNAKSNPFIYFYEDIISSPLKINYQVILGRPRYNSASDDAMACIEINTEFKKLSKYSIGGWLNNALKFADHFVLHYIQDVINVKPIQYPMTGVEKSRYIQIEGMSGDISIAGEKLKRMYELRSKQFEHRTRKLADGRQELINPPRNAIKKEIEKLYPLVLKLFVNVYSVTHPQQKI